MQREKDDDPTAVDVLGGAVSDDEFRKPPSSVRQSELDLFKIDPERQDDTGDFKKAPFELFIEDDDVSGIVTPPEISGGRADGADGGGHDHSHGLSLYSNAANRSALSIDPWSSAITLFLLHIPVQWVFLLIIAFLNMAKSMHRGGSIVAHIPSIFGSNVTDSTSTGSRNVVTLASSLSVSPSQS